MSLFLTLIYILNIAFTSFAINTTNDELYATLQAEIRPILLQYLPSDYDLPLNVYEWNVTQIVGYINQKDSQLLYTMDTSLLFTLFPIYFIQELPRDILIAHHLYQYLQITDALYCFNITNCSSNPPIISKIDACYGPFVNTKYDGVFIFPNGSDSYQCALRCEHTQILWNIDNEEMATIDTFNGIFCILFLTICIIIWINICMDIKFSNKKFSKRPFLFHAPICLVFFYTIVAFCFLLPLIIGRDSITCVNDMNNIATFGSENPGSSVICSIMGILFYSGEMAAGAYTTCFSIVLWRQFHGPLISLVNELNCKCKYKCKYKCKCKAKDTIRKSIDNAITTRSHHYLVDIFCSNTAIIHYFIYIFTIIFTLIGCIQHAIGAIPPLGICTIGTLGNNKTNYIIYNIIPHSIFSILSTLFLPPAIVLLIRIVKKSKSTNIKSQFKKLQWRLLVYFMCIQTAWFGIVLLTFVFHLQRPQFEIAAENRTKCMLLKSGTDQDLNECMIGYKYWTGWYIIIGLMFPLVAFGSLVLSCNNQNRIRWKIICTFCLKNSQTNDEKMLKQLQDMHSVHSQEVESQKTSTENNNNNKQVSNKTESTPTAKT